VDGEGAGDGEAEEEDVLGSIFLEGIAETSILKNGWVVGLNR
jgi:hypothetical protein